MDEYSIFDSIMVVTPQWIQQHLKGTIYIFQFYFIVITLVEVCLDLTLARILYRCFDLLLLF